MLDKLSLLASRLNTLAQLPVARLEFRRELNPEHVASVHRYFTKPHPKYKVIQNKSVGAALLDLRRFASREEYLDSIQGKNSAGFHARKAKSKGYRLVEIDRNDYIDDIHAINISVETRQGRPMDAAYLQKITHFDAEKNFKYFGVLNAEGRLTGYGDLGFYGNFAAFNRVIGVRNNHGMMHMMITEIVCQAIEARTCNYIMYDTCFGASPGLLQFKEMLGFQPYRAKYSIQ